VGGTYGHYPRLGEDKYLHTTEDPMDLTDQQLDQDYTLDAQREIIRQSLNEIVNEIGMVMRDAGLTFPVFLTVRK
jgi:hypothetical protein